MKLSEKAIEVGAAAVMEAHNRGVDESEFFEIGFNASMGQMLKEGYEIRVTPPAARFPEILAQIEKSLADPGKEFSEKFIVTRLSLEGLVGYIRDLKSSLAKSI